MGNGRQLRAVLEEFRTIFVGLAELRQERLNGLCIESDFIVL